MKCCNKEMSDFCHHDGWSITDPIVEHYYCSTCGKRYYRGKWYTTDEWFFYINGVTYNEFHRLLREQELAEDQARLEESLHTHELINRGDHDT